MIQRKIHLTLGQHRFERLKRGVCLFSLSLTPLPAFPPPPSLLPIGGCGRQGPWQVVSIEVDPVCIPAGFVLLERLLSWLEHTE